MNTVLQGYQSLAQGQVDALRKVIVGEAQVPDADRLVQELLEHHTAAVELEQVLREEQQELAGVAGVPRTHSGALVAAISSSGTIRYAGVGFERILGRKPYDVVNRSIYDLMEPGDADELANSLPLIAATAEPVRIRLRLTHAEGSSCIVTGTSRVVARSPAGPVILIRGHLAAFEPREDAEHRFFRLHVVSGAASAPALVREEVR